ncbi:MAG: hypothetical protein PHF81_11985 [Flavobacterium sp.]|nr:hypothetical protein [Flavobacterium sp.]
MHIAFLTPEYPHPKTGHFVGIETRIKILDSVLLAQESKVSVLVYGQKEDAVFDDEFTITIFFQHRFARIIE